MWSYKPLKSAEPKKKKKKKKKNVAGVFIELLLLRYKAKRTVYLSIGLPFCCFVVLYRN